MRWVIACALVLSACATVAPASAIPPPRSEAEACIIAAGRDAIVRRACVGRMAGACIARDEANATTAGTVMCAQAERDAWREMRNSYVIILRQRESAGQLALLDAMLAQHESWSQTRCAYDASLYEGGSLARALAADCMRDAEAGLALDLYARLFDEP